MIYTAAVYGAFKEDGGADIKTGLFMEGPVMCVCVWVTGRRCTVCVQMLIYRTRASHVQG